MLPVNWEDGRPSPVHRPCTPVVSVKSDTIRYVFLGDVISTTLHHGVNRSLPCWTAMKLHTRCAHCVPNDPPRWYGYAPTMRMWKRFRGAKLSWELAVLAVSEELLAVLDYHCPDGQPLRGLHGELYRQRDGDRPIRFSPAQRFREEQMQQPFDVRTVLMGLWQRNGALPRIETEPTEDMSDYDIPSLLPDPGEAPANDLVNQVMNYPATSPATSPAIIPAEAPLTQEQIRVAQNLAQKLYQQMRQRTKDSLGDQ